MLITIIGPTASGKTAVAARLARYLCSEVIGADSRQVYQGMDLGTGKDLADYIVDGVAVPYHLIDILPAGGKYNLFAYQHDFHRVYQQMLRRGIKHPILCGGTGLYVESVLRGYHLPDVPPDPALRQELATLSLRELTERLASYGPLHNSTDVDTAQRAIRAIEIAEYIQRERERGIVQTEFAPIDDSMIFCLDLPREVRRERITRRLLKRLDEGMTGEVEQLIASGVAPQDLIYYGLEYKFVTLYVLGQMSYNEMARQLEIAIHQFAKRQMTWFRGMERRGFSIHYIDALQSVEAQAQEILHTAGLHAERRLMIDDPNNDC